ncbi:hypothetical protein [Roseobacter sp. A03A-229]
MPDDKEENEARAIERIVDLATGETVGFFYVWEDGTKQPYWFDGVKSDVIAIELDKRVCTLS